MAELRNFLPASDPSSSSAAVDIYRQKFPFCLLWSPIPLITWIFPFIGHTAIGDSNGTSFDFAGPYSIGKGKMAFGSPTKYLILDPSKCMSKSWDSGVEEGCVVYSKRMHNLFLDNCHSHVARCLNEMAYDGCTTYSMLHIGVWMFFLGKFTSVSAVIKTFGPFVVLVVIILLFFR